MFEKNRNVFLLQAVVVLGIVFSGTAVAADYTTEHFIISSDLDPCFIEYAGKNEFFMGTSFTIALFLLFMGLKGVVLFIFSLVPVLLFIKYTKRKIGGMTGDTIGAVSEIAEVGVLLFTVCSY